MRSLAFAYLLASAGFVALLYLGWADRADRTSGLLVEAAFAWLAVFVPPLLLIERTIALARRIVTGVGNGRSNGH
ncbi:MAG: hypothetical protein NZ555_03545 [Geminicoccaceae bacterium]|nr:hypothetical protein [Geminicoccaceae bacterium]MCX8101010.1 hypothetical protein [Geminicoccaceae bacterium]MDW8370380.1 hypothetical protein [Geminicoccaceae bacterium]